MINIFKVKKLQGIELNLQISKCLQTCIQLYVPSYLSYVIYTLKKKDLLPTMHFLILNILRSWE